MRKASIYLLLSILFFMITISCKRDLITAEETEEMNNSGVMLNSEIMGLGNFFGNVFANEVLIHVQDGPTTALQTNELKALLENTDKDDDFFVFNIHQQQTKESEQFSEEITFEAAKVADQKSVDILAEVAQYFKNQDKKVYILGSGFGACIVQELLVREGTEVADRYLLMASRLDMPEIIWKSYSEGNTGGFIDGSTPFTGAPSTLTSEQKNMNKLIAGLAFKRYTRELSKFNDLTKITYCFGTKDESVGKLSQNEQALLITRQANLLEIEAGHIETIEGLLDQGFEMAFGEE